MVQIRQMLAMLRFDEVMIRHNYIFPLLGIGMAVEAYVMVYFCIFKLRSPVIFLISHQN